MEEVNASPISFSQFDRNSVEQVVIWLAQFHEITVPIGIDDNWIDVAIVEARRQIERATLACSWNYDAVGLRELLLAHSPASESKSLVRGDAMVGNWITDGHKVFGVDFEFTSIGNPGVDFGVLASSILVSCHFELSAYDLIRDLIQTYNGVKSGLIATDVQYGVLCGLILKSASVTDASSKSKILANARPSFERLGTLC